ncbi:MAG: leucyl aminopeptidase [Chloroflexi bacterium]|nr:leucyl aminopeptidase [Chloroflexota bacterium]
MRFRSITAADLATCDAVIVSVAAGGSVPAVLPRALRSRAERLVKAAGIGRLYSVDTDFGAKPERLVVVGVGASAAVTSERVRRAAATGIRSLLRAKVRRVALVLDPAVESRLGAASVVAASVSGALQAVYRRESHRSKPDAAPAPRTVGLLGSAVSGAALRRGAAWGEAAVFTRRLANEPGNLMTPERVAEEARALAKETGLAIEVLEAASCRKLGMHSFLSVAQGSHTPPKLIVLRHRGRTGTGVDLALVGKGITFDTGGISIKPADGMHHMKADMTGAAAVIGAIGAVARLKVKANVIAVAPCTENMPGSAATKPGDVFTSMSGKTVEVINTDAEGRLVLIDALTYAQREGARRIVDIATLTGAIQVALGDHFSGLFGRPDAFVAHVRELAESVGDRLWPMPLTDEFRDEVRGEVADLRNQAGRPGGASKAAAFLDAVVDQKAEWAHLDIASQDWLASDKPWSSGGPQAPGVHTLIALAEEAAPSIAG